MHFAWCILFFFSGSTHSTHILHYIVFIMVKSAVPSPTIEQVSVSKIFSAPPPYIGDLRFTGFADTTRGCLRIGGIP